MKTTKVDVKKEDADLIPFSFKNVPAFGIILGILSGLCFGLALVLAKHVYYINPFAQIFVRGIVHYSIFLAVTIYQREPIIPKVGWKSAILLFTSATFSALAPVSLYTSLKFIPVADSTAIMFTYPAIVSIISAAFLGDHCRLMHVVVVILSVAGSVLVSKPTGIFGSEYSTTATYTVYGVFLALGGSISFALYLLTLQKLANAVASSVLNLQAGACLVIFSIIAMSTIDSLGIPDCNADGLIVVVSGTLSTVGVLLTVQACKVENPRNVSVSQTIEMPGVIIFQVVILGTIPDWNSYVGTFLIIVSVLLTWGIKWWENREKEKVTSVSVMENSSLLEESAV